MIHTVVDCHEHLGNAKASLEVAHLFAWTKIVER